jgi:hypothetical protein
MCAMRPEELKNIIRRQPFLPVRIFLSDGTTYDIRHPEMAFITRSTVEVGREAREGSGIADDVVYISLVHVVRAEHIDGQVTAPSTMGPA